MKKHTIAAHNSRILFWVQFFGTINFLQPVITLFYMERGLSSSSIFFVLMCWSGAVLLGEVPSGIFADRFGAKASFITGEILKILSFVLLFFANEPWMFFLYSALNGFSVTFFSGADEALIYESLRESQEEQFMDRTMGKIQSAGFISTMLAVLFGAYAAHGLKDQQFQLLILLGIFFYMVEFLLLFFIKNPSAAQPYRENPFSQVKEGLHVIRKAPHLLFMFLNVTLVFIPAGAVYQYFDQPLFKTAGLPIVMIGVLYAGASATGFLASQSLGWLTARFSRVWLLNISGWLAVAGLIVSALLNRSLWVVLGAFLVLRLVRAVRYPIYSQLSNDIIPSEVRATTISLLSILDSVFDLLIFGILSMLAAWGISAVLIGCALIALIGTLLPIKKSRQKFLVYENIKSEQ